MNRWISVMVMVVAPLLWHCSEKTEVVTTTESSATIGQTTNPSPIPAAPEPVSAAATPQASSADPVTSPLAAAGPPLRNPTAAPLADPIATVRRIDLRDAERLFNSGDAIVVDVRSEADYAKSHVRGAINIPVALVQSRASELPRDKMIITYCT